KLLNHNIIELSIAGNNYLVSKYSDLNGISSITSYDSKDIFMVTISQSDISNLTTAINHTDLIDELPKFLGFDNPIAGLDDNCEPYVAFELIVKGYESIGGV